MNQCRWLIITVSIFMAPMVLNAQIKSKSLHGLWVNEADKRSKFFFEKKFAYQIYANDTLINYTYIIKDTFINSNSVNKYLFLYSKEDTSYFEILGLTKSNLSLFSKGKRYFYTKKSTSNTSGLLIK